MVWDSDPVRVCACGEVGTHGFEFRIPYFQMILKTYLKYPLNILDAQKNVIIKKEDTESEKKVSENKVKVEKGKIENKIDTKDKKRVEKIEKKPKSILSKIKSLAQKKLK